MDQVLKITQAYSQIPWRKQIQNAVMFLVFLILCLVITMIYVNVNAKAVVVGREIQDMQSSIEELERSIADKESQLASCRRRDLRSTLFEERSYCLY